MDLSADQRGEIVVVDELFAVADFLEADEDGLEFGRAETAARPLCLVSGSSVFPQPTISGSMIS